MNDATRNLLYFPFALCAYIIELRLEPKHTTPTPYVALSLTTAKPKKKNHQSHKDKSTVVDNNRIKETQQIPNHIQENDISGIVEGMNFSSHTHESFSKYFIF